MTDRTADQSPASLSTPHTHRDYVQQSHVSNGVWEPYHGGTYSLGLGELGAPGISSKNPSTFSLSLPKSDNSALAQQSSSSAIATSSTTSLNAHAGFFAPAVFPNASPPLSGPTAISNPNGGLNIAPTPFFPTQLIHGDVHRSASSGGPARPPLTNDDLLLSRPSAQQRLSSLPPLTTTTAPPLVHSDLTTSANGTHRSDTLSGNSPAAVNKPVLKMKRTGQNFPLNSGSRSPHQRNGSNSPNRRQGSIPGSTTRKASDLVTKGELVTKGGQEQPAKNEEPKPQGVRPSEKLSATFHIEPQQNIPSLGNAGPKSPSNTSREPTNNGSAKHIATISDSDTDDIIYETAAQIEELDGAIEDVDSDSSSDDSESQSDDGEETTGMDAAGEASSRQLFRAPDQEDDDADSGEEDSDEEEDEGEEEDDATSVSSSGDSLVANEPAVALPSAKIQHQEAYPSNILEHAEPGRLYTEYRDKGVTIKAGPALFPVGYIKSTTHGFPWVCAVRSCRLLYKTPAGLANHARFTHKKAMFNDNMDGTVSLVGSYSKKNQSGHFPPVVVSKRPLDSQEPPMRESAIPASKHFSGKVRSLAKQVSASLLVDGDKVIMDGGNGASDADNLKPNTRSPPSTADPRSSEQMWEYIRPFLSNHDSLPDLNWASQIIHLPRVREIKWNEDRNKEHPFKDTHPRDVTALIVQITGVESPKPCDHCLQGRGPFTGCIVISPEAPHDAKRSVLSCANCYYHCNQSFCSLCKDAVARRVRRARVGQKPDNYNVKLLSDVAHLKPVKAAVTKRQGFSGSKTALEAPARPKTRLYLPSEFKSIEMASSTRTYKVIKGQDGKDVLMCGALIPEKYDLDHTVPGYPWICPVRSCRRVFKKIASVGSHFVRGHPGALLNDNQDGTLSQIGHYTIPQPGHNGLPALIISQDPLDPREPPMETPGLPGGANQASKTSKAKFNTKKSPATALTQSRQLATSHSKELWDYVLPYLPESRTSISSDPKALSLFNLPRQREIQWRKDLQNVRVMDDKRQILGLIIYLTGEKHKNGERSCTHCVRRNGPFPGCFTLTKGVPEDAQSMVKSCANCVFTHMSSSCSIKSGWSRESDERSQTDAGAKKRVWVTDDESEEPAAVRRRSDRLGLADEEDRTQPKKKVVLLSLKRNRRSAPVSNGDAPTPVQMGTASNGSILKGESSSALVHAGQIQPDDLLEMEDWEIAPGRIRATGADGTNNNIAFSKSYLEANRAVRVSRNVTFEVKTIKSGANLDLDADETKTRYCTLASGKLYVDVDEEKPFTIGPHGLFKLAPGSAAKIQNRLYIDSVLHISAHVND